MTEKSRFSIDLRGLCVCVLVFFLGYQVFKNMEILRRDFENGKNFARLNEFRDLLPALRSRLNSKNLGFERLYFAFGQEEEINSKNCASIVENLNREFGTWVRFAAWDKDSRLISSRGFSENSIELYRQLFSIIPEVRKKGKESFLDTDSARQLNRKIFNLSLSLMQIQEEKVRVFEFEHFGEKVLGLFFFSRKKGCLIAIVPQERLDEEWAAKAFRRSDLCFNASWNLVNEKELCEIASFPENVRDELQKRLRVGVWQSVFERDDWKVGFVRFSEFPQKVVVFLEPPDSFSKNFRFLWFTSWGILFLAIVGSGISIFFRGVFDWKAPLIRKFGFFVIFSGFIPTLGLSWIILSHMQWNDLLQKGNRWKDLELKLEEIETRNDQFMSKCHAQLKKFTHPSNWRGKNFVERIPDLSKGTEILRYSNFVCALHGKVGIIWMKIVPREGLTNVKKLYLNWLTYILDGLKVKINTESQKTPVETPWELVDEYRIDRATYDNLIKTGRSNLILPAKELLGEKLQEMGETLAGKDSFFEMVRKQETMLPSGFSNSLMWSYLKMILGLGDTPPIVFYATFDRRLVQRKKVFEYFDTAPSSGTFLPKIMLMSDDSRFFDFVPKWVESRVNTFPFLRQILCGVARQGARQRIIFRTPEGKKMLGLAKPLRGLDYVGLALVEGEAGEDKIENFLALGAIVYPCFIGIMAVLLFNSFFLRPIKVLRENVDQIARGNYEVQVPVLTDDEIGTLCKSFNTMAAGLKEKEFLSRFLTEGDRELIKE